jgi:hypothetical protein
MEKRMKHRMTRIAAALALGVLLSLATASQAQAPAAGNAKAQKLAALAKQLNLSPEQEKQLMPILEADAPKIEAIKNNAQLGPLQKLEQIKAVRAASDPQVKAILNPQQYDQLQQIRQQEMHAAMEKRMQ